MENNVRDLGERIQKLQTEIAIMQRRRSQEAEAIVKALSSISKEDINLLLPIVPELAAITAFSKEDLENNANNERKQISDIVTRLRSYLEQRLSYYEDKL